ncbi:DMT family transporter [Flammeovirga pectinis]|uniref:DMT family transporter n=1 Tax=Flammeovirga pectinis TaxID=2494373 RepID=A0A3S9P664_9BACT|nr:DMT family transporter [Flammeovirga pectinis]AZQ63686.1 DMT family transporter [Flammeovirga pectinis]
MKKVSKIQAHLFLLAASVIYGCNFIISKIAMPEFIGPKAFIFLRILGGAFLFYLLHAFTVKEKVTDKKDYIRLFFAGMFGACFNQLIFFEGLAKTSSINASVIVVSSPVIVLICSAIFLKEKVNIKKVIGIALGLSGAVLMIGLNGIAFHSGSVEGDIMVLINACFYSIYLVITKPLLAKYHPFTLMKWVFLFAIPIVALITWKDVEQTNWVEIPSHIWLSISYVVIGNTFLAYLFYAIAMQTVNASTASFYIYFQPMIAGFIAVFFLNEELKAVQIIAAVFIFLGVYLISGKKKKINQS